MIELGGSVPRTLARASVARLGSGGLGAGRPRASGRSAQGLGAHREHKVRTLPSHLGPIREIEPLPTDLPQGVGSALRGRPALLFTTRASLRIEHGTKCDEKALTVLGIELSVEAHHAQERDRGVKAPAGFEAFLAVKPLLGLDPIAPVRRDPSQVVDRVDPAGLDELTLAPLERGGMSVVGFREHLGSR